MATIKHSILFIKDKRYFIFNEMDVSCDDKILQGVRELIKENILPRLTQIEQEVRELRRVCWPVCQSLRETSQLTDTRNKKRFLALLDEDEIQLLLREKAVVSSRPLTFSSSNLLNDEFQLLFSWKELAELRI